MSKLVWEETAPSDKFPGEKLNTRERFRYAEDAVEFICKGCELEDKWMEGGDICRIQADGGFGDQPNEWRVLDGVPKCVCWAKAGDAK